MRRSVAKVIGSVCVRVWGRAKIGAAVRCGNASTSWVSVSEGKDTTVHNAKTSAGSLSLWLQSSVTLRGLVQRNHHCPLTQSDRKRTKGNMSQRDCCAERRGRENQRAPQDQWGGTAVGAALRFFEQGRSFPCRGAGGQHTTTHQAPPDRMPARVRANTMKNQGRRRKD